MYIKLNFTNSRTGEQVFRILTDIINNPSVITSVSNLVTRFADTAYYTPNDLQVGFDSTNSEIIATTPVTSLTKAHIARTVATTNTFTFTLEQSVYDNTSTKYYTRIYANANDANIYGQVGDSITGGTITSAQIDKTTNSATTNLAGTSLTLTNGYTPTGLEYISTQNLVIRTLWCYITDKTFLISFNGTTNAITGWNGTYASPANTATNIFVSQYTRLDHWNSSSNNVIPVAFTKPRTVVGSATAPYGSGLFMNIPDYTYIWNSANTATSANIQEPIIILNGYNTAASSTGINIVKTWNIYTSHGLGLKSTELQPMTAAAVTEDTTTTATSGISYSPPGLSTASSGIPNAAINSRTFPLFPLTWMRSNFGAYGGGNISEQSGFYIFCGDYAAGDEFQYNGIIYSLWPSGAASPATSRIGLAVPKT